MNRYALHEAMIVLTAFAAVVFIWTAVRALWYAPEMQVPAPELERSAPAAVVDPDDLPKRLEIPKLQVDAAIQHVGINAEGNMAAPSNFTDVGWYKYGPVPGMIGSAVIDGHVDNGLKLAGVFKKLDQLAIGDDIYVETQSGKKLHFKVTEVSTYNYKEAPLERIFKRDDKVRLNLITCDGDWVKTAKTYEERRVVYTELQAS